MKATLKIQEEISYAHRLQDHPGKCKTLHGHNALLQIEITGEVDEQTGMVRDFGEIKMIASTFDHQTILEETDPLRPLIEQIHPVVCCQYAPTAEVLADAVACMLLADYPLDSVKVLWPETCKGAAEVTRVKGDEK